MGVIAVAGAAKAAKAIGGLLDDRGVFTDKDEERKAEFARKLRAALAGNASMLADLYGRAGFGAAGKAAPTAKSRNYAKDALRSYYATTGVQPNAAQAQFLGVAEPVATNRAQSAANAVRATIERGGDSIARDVESARIEQVKGAAMPWIAIGLALVVVVVIVRSRKAV